MAKPTEADKEWERKVAEANGLGTVFSEFHCVRCGYETNEDGTQHFDTEGKPMEKPHEADTIPVYLRFQPVQHARIEEWGGVAG